MKILYVEDSPLDAELITEALIEQSFEKSDITIALNGIEFQEIIKKSSFDIIITDYDIGDITAMDVLSICRREDILIPVICVSGVIGEEKAVNLLKHGFTDYILKDKTERLGVAIKNAVSMYMDKQKTLMMQRQMEESEEKYRKLFSNMFLGIAIHELILDENGKAVDYRFLDINDEAVVMLGSDKKDIIGKTAKEIFYKESPPYIDKYEIVGLKGKTYSFTAYSITLNKYFLTRAYSTEYKQFITIFEDITEKLEVERKQKRDEAIIRNQQKLESIGLLASGVAHEINNPINGIMNYGQLITEIQNQAEETYEYAGEIISESKRIATIVKNLLQFSRYESEKYEAVAIDDVIKGVVSLAKMITKEDNIQLEIDIQPDLPYIECKSQQIQQVLMNLITNSRNALNKKFPKSSMDKLIKINCISVTESNNEYIQTCVEDNGCGIDSSIMEKIYDPFFTTNERTEGTGLGLSISYGIIKDNHGKIHCESKKNQYTKFYIVLPVIRNESE